MNELLAVITITILAVISPGADFAVVTKNSYLFGRKVGLFTSIGISLGVLVHVSYTLLAIAFVMAYTPSVLQMVKYIGAIYLLYIGYKTFIQKPIYDDKNSKNITANRALTNGFFTNALNPKTTLFVISTYTQIVQASTPTAILLGYGGFMSVAHLLWFAFVAVVFSSPRLQEKMLAKQQIINRFIGVLLMGLGIGLLLTSIQR